MEFPSEIVKLIHEYDRPLLRVDLVRKYREGAAILGEWPMVKACLQTDRADAIMTIFEAVATAKAAWDKADEVRLCITRRTHPVGKIRWAAEDAADEVVSKHRREYNALMLSLRILLVGEAVVAQEEARMNDFHDLCEHELDYMNDVE